MVEVIGDVVMPSEFFLPQGSTTEINSISGALLISGAMMYNTTLHKAELFVGGVGWETITSVAR